MNLRKRIAYSDEQYVEKILQEVHAKTDDTIICYPQNNQKYMIGWIRCGKDESRPCLMNYPVLDYNELIDHAIQSVFEDEIVAIGIFLGADYEAYSRILERLENEPRLKKSHIINVLARYSKERLKRPSLIGKTYQEIESDYNYYSSCLERAKKLMDLKNDG